MGINGSYFAVICPACLKCFRTSQEAPNETSLNNSRKSATSIGIILNLQSTTVANTLNTLNSSRCTLDYVIATMETGNSDMENFRLYKNFRWINLNTGKEPVDGILSRVVHKRLLEDRNQRENLDEKHVIKLWVWMEQFSKKIMQLVVKLGLQNVIRTGLFPFRFFFHHIEKNAQLLESFPLI